MKQLLAQLTVATGWRGAIVTLSAGAVSGLTQPSFDWWLLWFFTLPLFLGRLSCVTAAASAFRAGLLFGFGYFAVTLHWIGFAFLVDANTYLWMMPFAVAGLALLAALYWGLGAWLAYQGLRRRMPLYLAFPASLALCEWLRGHLLSGFPWAAPGLSADGMGAVIQTASLTGMTGLTLLILLWGASPYGWISDPAPASRRIVLVIFATLPLLWLWGTWRESTIPLDTVKGVVFRIVQPNVAQDSKWRSSNARDIFDGLVALSSQPGREGPAITHIVWPESAVPFLIDESEGGLAVLAEMLAPGQSLITGAIRRTAPDPLADYFTSVLVFDAAAEVRGVYDKWRLVPGGEYLPFAGILEPLGFQRLVNLPGSFTAGTGPKTVALPGGITAGLIICYEAIFPNRLIDPQHRPDLLINVTNDGWFGNSTGPYQHLAQARMRAIEQGLPLVRSANTGISAIVDAAGRTLHQLALGQQGVIDTPLPVTIPVTFYSAWGDLILLGLLVIVALVLIHFAWKLR